MGNRRRTIHESVALMLTKTASRRYCDSTTISGQGRHFIEQLQMRDADSTESHDMNSGMVRTASGDPNDRFKIPFRLPIIQ